MTFDFASAAVGAAAGAVPALIAGGVVASRWWSRRAQTDALTGVWNRRGLHRLDHAMTRRIDRGSVALLVLDARGFKAINDTHGHDVGDQVLVRLAQRLANYPATIETVRLGGDEFAAVIGLESPHRRGPYAHQVTRVYDAIVGMTVAGPATVVDLDVTIGAAIAHRGDMNLSRLLTAADTAMYAARRESKPVHVVFGGLTAPARPTNRRRDSRTAATVPADGPVAA